MTEILSIVLLIAGTLITYQIAYAQGYRHGRGQAPLFASPVLEAKRLIAAKSDTPRVDPTKTPDEYKHGDTPPTLKL